jgi:hypothetical protein
MAWLGVGGVCSAPPMSAHVGDAVRAQTGKRTCAAGRAHESASVRVCTAHTHSWPVRWEDTQNNTLPCAPRCRTRWGNFEYSHWVLDTQNNTCRVRCGVAVRRCARAAHRLDRRRRWVTRSTHSWVLGVLTVGYSPAVGYSEYSQWGTRRAPKGCRLHAPLTAPATVAGPLAAPAVGYSDYSQGGTLEYSQWGTRRTPRGCRLHAPLTAPSSVAGPLAVKAWRTTPTSEQCLSGNPAASA